MPRHLPSHEFNGQVAETRGRETERRFSRLAPHTLFFPAAALYAAVALPWSVLAMTGVVAGPASLSTPFGHAHEMLLGYALAVVAGNQLPLMACTRAILLFGLWLAARLTFVAVSAATAVTFDVAFAMVLALHIAPRLFRAAKKLRNQGLPVVLTALCASAVALHLITIGALGTLTLNVMANTMLLKTRRSPAEQWIPSLGTALIGGATVLRVAAGFAETRAVILLMLAAACWSCSFVVLLWLLQRCMFVAMKRTQAPNERPR